MFFSIHTELGRISSPIYIYIPKTTRICFIAHMLQHRQHPQFRHGPRHGTSMVERCFLVGKTTDSNLKFVKMVRLRDTQQSPVRFERNMFWTYPFDIQRSLKLGKFIFKYYIVYFWGGIRYDWMSNNHGVSVAPWKLTVIEKENHLNLTFIIIRHPGPLPESIWTPPHLPIKHRSPQEVWLDVPGIVFQPLFFQGVINGCFWFPV